MQPLAPSLLLLLALAAANYDLYAAVPAPATSSAAFPRPLSSGAESVYRAVLAAAATTPDQSTVTSPSLIATSGNLGLEVGAYGDTDEHCRRLVAPSILSAKEEVLMTTFLYEHSGHCSKLIADAILKLDSQDGGTVRVNIVIDAVSQVRFAMSKPSWGTLPSWRDMFANGLSESKASKFKLPDPAALKRVKLRVKTYHRWPVGTLHSKLLVIDGGKLVAGSKNMDDNNGYEYAVGMEGAVAGSARADFQDLWEESLPSLKIPPKVDVDGRVPMLYLTRRQNANPLVNKEGSTETVAWMTAVKNAKSDIYVQSPGFVTAEMADAVADAALRGVNVTVVTAFYWQNFFEKFYPKSAGDNRQTAARMYRRLRDAGARGATALKHFRVCYFIGKRVDAPASPAKREWSHVKYMAIDQQYHIFGTGNIDPQSFYNSREDNILVDDAAATKRVTALLLAPQQSLQHCYHDKHGTREGAGDIGEEYHGGDADPIADPYFMDGEAEEGIDATD